VYKGVDEARESMRAASIKCWEDEAYVYRVISAKTTIKKRVRCSNGMTFESASFARRWLLSVGAKSVHSGNIHKACRAHGATAYQHTWAYVDEPQNTEIKE